MCVKYILTVLLTENCPNCGEMNIDCTCTEEEREKAALKEMQ